MPRDTISSFVLKVDGSCEKALIPPKSTVFLPQLLKDFLTHITTLECEEAGCDFVSCKGRTFLPFPPIHTRPIPTGTKDLFFPSQITLPAEEL